MKTPLPFILLFLLFSYAVSGQKNKDKPPKPSKDSTSVTTITAAAIDNSGSQRFVPPSPNAAQLGSFGAAEIGMFTGTAKYSVPLYTFETSNISLPIALSYSSNGLKVDEQASWVGYNWALSAGGVINRYRKGKVDQPGNRQTYREWGSMSATDKYNYCMAVTSGGTDSEPDIFVFSFMNYSGRFVIDGSGIPRLIPFSKLKVETNTSGNYTFFRITAPDGIIYKFYQYETTFPVSEPSFPTSWYLTSIVHPTGDSIAFSYDNAFVRQYTGTVQTVSLNILSTGEGAVCPSPNFAEKLVYNDNSVLFLKEINFFKYGKVLFERTLRADAEGDYKLDRVVIRDFNSNQVKAFRFWYQFPYRNNLFTANANAIAGSFDLNTGKHNYRMFLDSVQFLDNVNQRISSYKFSYNDLSGLPARFSYSQDHWGYFNGKPNEDFVQLSAVPQLYRNLFSVYVPTIANRKADFNFSKKGMLNTITFPTGGFTTIEYESNKNEAGNEIGGCRVLRTKTYESASSPPQIKKYIYSNARSYSDTTYFISYISNYFSYVNPNGPGYYSGSCTEGSLSSNSVYDIFIDGRYHVVYLIVSVLEGENGENGKTEHNFEYWYDAPGTRVNGAMVLPLPRNMSGYESGIEYRTAVYDNISTIRKENLTGHKFSETRNSFNIKCHAINARPIPPVPLDDSQRLEFFDVVPYEINSRWYYVDSLKNTEYYGNSAIVQKSGFAYENQVHAQLTKETSVNSSGQTVQKKYYYPDDYSRVENFAVLIGKNIINQPIDSRTYVNSQLVSGEQIKFNDYGQPSDIYRAEIASNVTDIAFETGNPFKFTHKLTYQYDGVKNIRQAIPDDNQNTTYLWSYNSSYPVAKIENATFTQISTALGASLINSLAAATDQAAISSYLSQVRNTLSSGLTGAFVTTYIYKPLVGITSKTDPAGTSFYYEYDSFGRLKLIRDQENNIVKKLDYHYAGQ